MTTIRNYINPEVLDVSDTDGTLVVKFRSINPQYNPWTNDAPVFIYSKAELDDLEEQMLFIEDVLDRLNANTHPNNTEEFKMFHTSISTILEQAYDTMEAQDECEINTYSAKPTNNQHKQSINITPVKSTKISTGLDLEQQLFNHFADDLDNRPKGLARFFCTNFDYNPN